MRYPEELIEEIRTKNDIVEVISGYARSTMKNPPPSLSRRASRCTTVSAAGRVAM